MISISTIILVEQGKELPKPFEGAPPGATHLARLPSYIDGQRPLLSSVVVPNAKKAMKGVLLAKITGELQESEHGGDEGETRVAIMVDEDDFDVLVVNPVLAFPLGAPSFTLSGLLIKVVQKPNGPLLLLEVGNANVGWRVGIMLQSYTNKAVEFFRQSTAGSVALMSVGRYAFTQHSPTHLLIFQPAFIDRTFPPNPFAPIRPFLDPVKGMTYEEAHHLEDHTTLENAHAKLFRVPGKRRNRHSHSMAGKNEGAAGSK